MEQRLIKVEEHLARVASKLAATELALTALLQAMADDPKVHVRMERVIELSRNQGMDKSQPSLFLRLLEYQHALNPSRP